MKFLLYTCSRYFIVRPVYSPQHLVLKYPLSLYFIFVHETCFYAHIKQHVKCNVLLKNKSHILCVCVW
jgi:hypothetical protein